jgi:hypothetical protein
VIQLDLFETGELVQIKRFLTCWNEAERAKRLADVKNPKRVSAGGKLAEASGRKL